MNDIDPDIDDVGGGALEVAAAAGAGLACLSCGEALNGAYCSNCGQMNDDLRRNSFLLARDFLRDTFGFDSRMWRTLGLMAIAPGTVPRNYAHGRRSRYTPPVRLFLVISFLFFLTLGLTHTMFIALEITPKTSEELAADKAAAKAEVEEALKLSGREIPEDSMVEIEGQAEDCPINVKTKFFVRPADVKVDGEAWRKCTESIRANLKVEVNEVEQDAALRARFDRVIAGISSAVEHPEEFNRDVNDWLARIMFLMTPVLAVLLAMFIRGKDAFLFDHLILSLYLHAAAFAIVGLGILAAIAHVPHAAPAAAGAIGLYFLIALKRAYRRGWIKTTLATIFVSLFYIIILAAATTTIVGNAVWRSAESLNFAEAFAAREESPSASSMT
jgi:hypothetical protein